MPKLVIQNSETITVTKVLPTSTTKAWHLDCEGDEVWLPKSQVNFDKSKMQVEMPQWLFEKKFPDG